MAIGRRSAYRSFATGSSLFEYFGTMGCRTANGFDVNFEEVYRKNIQSVISNGTLYCDTLLSGAQKDGRGNIAPSTIIMPTLAMQALDEDEVEALKSGKIIGDNEKKIDKFMRILSRHIPTLPALPPCCR